MKQADDDTCKALAKELRALKRKARPDRVALIEAQAQAQSWELKCKKLNETLEKAQQDSNLFADRLANYDDLEALCSLQKQEIDDLKIQ